MEMTMKTIIIEGQRIFRRKKHGMDFVALELIRELQKLDTFNQYVIAVGPGEDVCLDETPNFKIEVLNSSNYFIWEQVLLPQLVKRYQADLLHCTSNTAPLFIKCPLVLTLHDIIFMEDKIGKNASSYQKLGRIYRRFVVPRVLDKVSHVITVSNYEKANILKKYPNLSDKLSTVYNGVGAEFRPIRETNISELEQLGRENFWLFLGNTDPKKNMRNTLLAYAQYLESSAIKRRLLLLDTDEVVLDRLLTELSIEKIKSHVTIQGYIPHHELPEWYSYAFGSLYTSLRESFGLPLIEAMACETAVIGSNTSSIPEIAGDAIVYVDPTNANNMAEAMLRLEDNVALVKEKQRLGIERSALYSWKATGIKTLELYNEIFARS